MEIVKVLTSEDIKNMTQKEREDLASSMLTPVKWCGGSHVDESGIRWYKHNDGWKTYQEHRDIINGWRRTANPTWSEESLKPYLLPDEEP
jgi:hypothetical protein